MNTINIKHYKNLFKNKNELLVTMQEKANNNINNNNEYNNIYNILIKTINDNIFLFIILLKRQKIMKKIKKTGGEF